MINIIQFMFQYTVNTFFSLQLVLYLQGPHVTEALGEKVYYIAPLCKNTSLPIV
jgi:hypothetical protein